MFLSKLEQSWLDKMKKKTTITRQAPDLQHTAPYAAPCIYRLPAESENKRECRQEGVQVTLYSQKSRTLDELREAPGSKTLCITVSLPFDKTYQDNKTESEPAGFKRPPCSLLRQWPIQDKLPRLWGGVSSEVIFNESLNENIHESTKRGWDHTRETTQTAPITATTKVKYKQVQLWRQWNNIFSPPPPPPSIWCHVLMSGKHRNPDSCCHGFGNSVSQQCKFARVLKHIGVKTRK